MPKKHVLVIVYAIIIMLGGFLGPAYAELNTDPRDISIFSKSPEAADDANAVTYAPLTQLDIDTYCEYFRITYNNLKLILASKEPDLTAKTKIMEAAGWDEARARYVMVIIPHVSEMDSNPEYLENVKKGRLPYPYGEVAEADMAIIRANRDKIQLVFDEFGGLQAE